MKEPCTDEKLPRFCVEKFEFIARSLSQIQGHTSASLENLRRLSEQLDDLAGKYGRLEARTGLLEAHDRRDDLWRKRIWQLLVGAGLVALGALLR
jgi:hypothetical protein